MYSNIFLKKMYIIPFSKITSIGEEQRCADPKN